jgi:hypothetical protein
MSQVNNEVVFTIGCEESKGIINEKGTDWRGVGRLDNIPKWGDIQICLLTLLGRIMDTLKRKPRWNIASAVLQPVAILAAFVALIITSQPESLIGLIYAVPTYAVFSFFGVVAGTVALFRQERWLALSWIALVINAIPFLWMFGIIAQKVHL